MKSHDHSMLQYKTVFTIKLDFNFQLLITSKRVLNETIKYNTNIEKHVMCVKQI